MSFVFGQPSFIDNSLNSIDTEAVQPLEEMLERADPLLDLLDIDTAVTDLSRFMGTAVASYAKHEEGNGQLYSDMIELTWDNMNEYPVEDGDAELMIPKINPLINPIRDKNPSYTTGVGFSEWFSFAGIFTQGNTPILMRSYHYADFGDFIDILGNDDLRTGYNDELENLLPPANDRRLFNTVFPSEDETAGAQPTPFELPDIFAELPDFGEFPDPGGTSPGIIAGGGDDDTAARAQIWADAVNSNRNWTWAEIDPNSTGTQRSQARAYARENGLVPHIPVDPDTGYADFSSVRVGPNRQLPEYLWEGSRDDHFEWLDEEFGRPPGHTWHHHEDSGVMQLIPFGIHRSTNHGGGCTTWAPNC